VNAMHEEWTDRLSEYLDNELPRDERYAIESHLAGCAECTAALDELRRVAERARTLMPRPPAADLWTGIAARIGADAAPPARIAQFRLREPRRVSFTLPQLAAASVLLAVLSGGAAWTIQSRVGKPDGAHDTRPDAAIAGTGSPDLQVQPGAAGGDAPADAAVHVDPVSLADDQYDAAVADLERALKQGRGRLDTATVKIVEQNLQVIDQAIDQARKALLADPANSYLSTHLVETRRRKLDLLRRAAALMSESD